MLPFGVFITGVGGQGILLASEILSDVALAAGKDVKKSEVHGMAQRGGTVVCAVRFGEKVYSPVIAEAEADVILSFEMMETLRNIKFASPNAKIIASKRKIPPAAVSMGETTYPDDIEDRIKTKYPDALLIDAQKIAIEAGSVKADNVVLLGALSNHLPFSDDIWEKAIAGRVPPKTIDINMKAFALGKAATNK